MGNDCSVKYIVQLAITNAITYVFPFVHRIIVKLTLESVTNLNTQEGRDNEA